MRRAFPQTGFTQAVLIRRVRKYKVKYNLPSASEICSRCAQVAIALEFVARSPLDFCQELCNRARDSRFCAIRALFSPRSIEVSGLRAVRGESHETWRTDDFNERQINKSCAKPADRPRFERTNRSLSSLLSSRALREDLCSLPLSAFSRGGVASCRTLYYKSANVGSDRTLFDTASLIARRCESLSRGITTRYCFRLECHIGKWQPYAFVTSQPGRIGEGERGE